MTQNAIAKLGDFAPPELTDKKREHKSTDPNNLRRLLNLVGKPSRVAELLGVTGTTINNAVNTGKASVPLELAAQLVLNRDFPTLPEEKKTRTAVVIAEPHHIKTIRDMVQAVGGQCTVIPERES